MKKSFSINNTVYKYSGSRVRRTIGKHISYVYDVNVGCVVSLEAFLSTGIILSMLRNVSEGLIV